MHFVYISKVKLATLIESNPKDPLSIASTRDVGEGATPFPGLFHFTLDPYLIMLIVKQGSIKYHIFESLVWLHLEFEPRSPGPLANTVCVIGRKTQRTVIWLL